MRFSELPQVRGQQSSRAVSRQAVWVQGPRSWVEAVWLLPVPVHSVISGPSTVLGHRRSSGNVLKEGRRKFPHVSRTVSDHFSHINSLMESCLLQTQLIWSMMTLNNRSPEKRLIPKAGCQVQMYQWIQCLFWKIQVELIPVVLKST